MKKKITIYLSIIVGVIAIAVIGFFTIRGLDNDASSLPIVDGDIADGEVIDMPKNIVFKKNASESEDGSSITIKCTVLPSDANNKKVIWSLEWVKECEEDVHDYVSLGISEDTSLCTITVIKGFSVQINVNVASEENPTIKKTCVLDYYKRFYIDEASFAGVVNGNYNKTTNHVTIGNLYENRYEAGALNRLSVFSDENLIVTSAGTTGSAYLEYDISYQFSEEFIESYRKYKTDTTLSSSMKYKSGGDCVDESFEEFFYNIRDEYASDAASFLKAMRGLETVFTFYMTAVSRSNDGTIFANYDFSCTVGNVEVENLFKVSDIILDNESYIFG